MKLCYPITTPDCTISMMAFGGDFEKNLEYIKSCGYEGVELLIRDLDLLNPEHILAQVKNAGLQAAAVATSPSPSQDKICIAHCDRKIHDEAMRRGKALAAFGGSIQVPTVVGRFRGMTGGGNPENTRKRLEEDLQEIGEYASQYGGSIALEIQNNKNVDTFNTVSEGVRWIEECKPKGIGLLLDTFHMDLTEPSMSAAFTEAKEHLQFVHLSDSERLVPGMGKLSFQEILMDLKRIGYEGYLSMEIKQVPDSFLVARLSADYLNYVDKVLLNDI